MSDESRVYTTQVATVLSADPNVLLSQRPNGEAARQVALAQLQEGSLRDGYQIDERTLAVTSSTVDGDQQVTVYRAYGRPIIGTQEGVGVYFTMNKLRFTPLDEGGRPRLDDAFVVDVGDVELQVLVEPVIVTTAFGQEARMHRMFLSTLSPAKGRDAYEAGLRASKLIKRIHRDLDDTANFAVEGWGLTGREGRWAYLGAPWLARPELALAVTNDSREEHSVDEEDGAPVIREVEFVRMDFLEARTRDGAQPWPATAPPVVNLGSGPSPMPHRPGMAYMLLATTVPPPASTCAYCGHPDPDHDLGEDGKPYCARGRDVEPSCSTCRTVLAGLAVGCER
ncbi:hypothetical protein AB0A05_27060 [Streptomyces sp. NPDC046374]|uniref:hypothetical protein n=1 Tax=Streptomyces sp. NPDC046374 TaxID=3154917 RepID=UPI0033C5DED6